LKALLIDSTAVRVHQHGAGALKKQQWSSRHAGHRQIKGWIDNEDSFK
jgi:hypothetical protein